MWAVVGKFFPQRRRRRQEASVPPHHDRQVNPFQCRVIQIRSGEGLGDKARRRGKARRVIVADQIVIYGFWYVHTAQGVAGTKRFLADNAHGVRRIVAANIKKVADAVRFEHFENLATVFRIWFIARRTQR